MKKFETRPSPCILPLKIKRVFPCYSKGRKIKKTGLVRAPVVYFTSYDPIFSVDTPLPNHLKPGDDTHSRVLLRFDK